jgi:hypothetical protein
MNLASLYSLNHPEKAAGGIICDTASRGTVIGWHARRAKKDEMDDNLRLVGGG